MATGSYHRHWLFFFAALSCITAALPGCIRKKTADATFTEQSAEVAVVAPFDHEAEYARSHAGYRASRLQFSPLITTAEEYFRQIAKNTPELISELSEMEMLLIVDELRSRFPMISLKERLAFESREGFTDSLTILPDPQTREVGFFMTTSRLKGWHRRMGSRESALEELHSSEVDRFIRDDGFGYNRMSPSSVHSLFLQEEFGELTPIPHDSRHFESANIRLPDGGFDIGNMDSREKGPWIKTGLPTNEYVHALHQTAERGFAHDAFNGWADDIEHVAGFVEHRVRFPAGWTGSLAGATKDAELEVPKNDWIVNRLQLVSLLMHDRPVIYDSTKLPDMRNASNVPVRELDAFESAALERLRAGEPMVVSSTQNRIRMLGPIRRFHDCADCHNAPENALIGAFSWELLRVPPISDPALGETWNSQ